MSKRAFVGFFVCLAALVGSQDILRAQTIKAYYNDLAAFNTAAGSPPVIVDFDNIAPGTSIAGTTIAGVRFDLGNTPSPSAPLVVVSAADTFTASGYVNISNPGLNKLPATTGTQILSPGGVTLGPGPNALVENDDILLTFNPPVSAVGFDVLYQMLDCCSLVSVTVLDPAGQVLLQSSLPTSCTGLQCDGRFGSLPGGSNFVGFVAASPKISKILIDDFDRDNYFPDNNIGLDSIRSVRGSTFTTLFGNIEEFQRLGGAPPILLTFRDFASGTDLTGQDLGDVTLNSSTGPMPGARLIVVPAADTFTPPGFKMVGDVSLNKLYATSDGNVLSPGGPVLGPGLDPAVENDDLELNFHPPVSSVGLDILFQERDKYSLTSLTVYDQAGGILFQEGQIPTGFIGEGDGRGKPGGPFFVGMVSSAPNISRVVIDEYDYDDGFADTNIGYDTIRYSRNPAGISLDVIPSSYPNLIDPLHSSAVQIAVLGSSSLDVSTLDLGTLTISGTVLIRPISADPAACEIRDTDGDSLADLVCSVPVPASSLIPGTGSIVLDGLTTSGEAVRGQDTASVPKPRVLRRPGDDVDPVQ